MLGYVESLKFQLSSLGGIYSKTMAHVAMCVCWFFIGVKAGIIRIGGHKKVLCFLSMYAYF